MIARRRSMSKKKVNHQNDVLCFRVIFFGLRLVGMRQGNVLLTSTSLVWFISLQVWEM